MSRLIVLDLPTAWDAWHMAMSREALSEASSLLDLAPGRSAARAAADRASRRIAASAAIVAADVNRLGGSVVSTYDAALAGLLVHAPVGSDDRLAGLPGVARVAPAPVIWLPEGEAADAPSLRHAGFDERHSPGGKHEPAALPLAPSANTAPTIAVIDTGMDYTHAALGGPGDPAAYAAARADLADPGELWQGRPLFPNGKVIAGWDFAGDGANADAADDCRLPGPCAELPEAAPDGDPLDLAGHGTAVASIAAGLAITDELGAAPAAHLVALKIFNRQLQSELLVSALDWVLRARMGEAGQPRVDVVNLSLGRLFGAETLAETEAFRRLDEAGVVVVAAAGNVAGGTAFGLSAPGDLPAVLAVGSVGRDTRGWFASAFSALGPARGLASKPDLAALGEDVPGATVGSGRGVQSLTGTSFAAPQVAGAAARLLQRPLSPRHARELLVTTADPAVVRAAGAVDGPAGVLQVGGGVMRAQAALTAALAIDTGSGGGLSFGLVALSGPVERRSTITVTNLTDGPLLVRPLTAAMRSPAWSAGAAARLDLSPAAVALAAGEAAPLTVTLAISPAALPPWFLSGGEGVLDGARYADAALDGWLRIEAAPLDSSSLRQPLYHLPVLALARRASTISASEGSAMATGPGTLTGSAVTLTNTSSFDGTAEVYRLLARGTSSPRPGGGPNVDLVAVRAQPVGDGFTHLEFLLHLAEAYRAPSDPRPVIELDTNGDQVVDYRLETATVWPDAAGQATRLVARLTQLPDDPFPPRERYPAGIDVQGRLLSLGLRAEDTGLTPSRLKLWARISMSLLGAWRDTAQPLVDRVPADGSWLSMDLRDAARRPGVYRVLVPSGGVRTVDGAPLVGSRGDLVVAFPDNAPASGDIITFDEPAGHELFLPWNAR